MKSFRAPSALVSVLAIAAGAPAACATGPYVPCGGQLPPELQPTDGKLPRNAVVSEADLFPYWRCMANYYKTEESFYRVGLAYEEGLGPRPDLGKAAYWYDKAAEPKSGIAFATIPARKGERFDKVIPMREGPPTPGHREAQYRLGLIKIKEGRLHAAHRWLKSAAEQGYEKAATRLNEVEAALGLTGG